MIDDIRKRNLSLAYKLQGCLWEAGLGRQGLGRQGLGGFCRKTTKMSKQKIAAQRGRQSILYFSPAGRIAQRMIVPAPSSTKKIARLPQDELEKVRDATTTGLKAFGYDLCDRNLQPCRAARGEFIERETRKTIPSYKNIWRSYRLAVPIGGIILLKRSVS